MGYHLVVYWRVSTLEGLKIFATHQSEVSLSWAELLMRMVCRAPEKVFIRLVPHAEHEKPLQSNTLTAVHRQ